VLNDLAQVLRRDVDADVELGQPLVGCVLVIRQPLGNAPVEELGLGGELA
jgi:hypothetical protein